MNLQSIKYFHEVVECKSISKVAANCHISQSALSQQIQKLEDNLGYKLLNRSNKGVELTEYGNVVHKYAENIIRTYDTMLEELINIDNHNSMIRIDSCWTVANYALPCTLYNMKKTFCHHNYNLASDSTDVVEQNILNDIYDLGFIYGKPKNDSLSYFKAGTENLVLVASTDFDIPSELMVEDLINYPFIMSSDKLRLKETLNQHLKKFKQRYDDFNIIFTLDSFESVKSSISNGYGISFIPYMSIKKDLYTKQLKEIKISNLDIDLDIYVIYKEANHKNQCVKEFIDYLKKMGKKSFC
jgi:LysR family transcriptional regulator, transcriptional activator of the cysJI operon